MMSKKIYKYTAGVADNITIYLPQGAEILHWAHMPGTTATVLTLWALVDPAAPTAAYRFCVYGTGMPCESPIGLHVATVIANPYVWHVFSEQTEEGPNG